MKYRVRHICKVCVPCAARERERERESGRCVYTLISYMRNLLGWLETRLAQIP